MVCKMRLLQKINLWCERLKKLKLIRIDDYCKEFGIEKTCFIKGEHVVVNRNTLKCYPLNDEIDISTEYNTCDSFLIKLKRVGIVGRSEFLIDGNLLIHYNEFKPALHVSSFEQFGKLKYISGFDYCRIRYKK